MRTWLAELSPDPAGPLFPARPGGRHSRDAVERLPGLQRDVLRLRFGFDGDSPASLQSTAERLGVGVRRVRVGCLRK